MKKPALQIEQEAKENVSALIDGFGEQIKDGTANADTFMTLALQRKIYLLKLDFRRDTI